MFVNVILLLNFFQSPAPESSVSRSAQFVDGVSLNSHSQCIFGIALYSLSVLAIALR